MSSWADDIPAEQGEQSDYGGYGGYSGYRGGGRSSGGGGASSGAAAGGGGGVNFLPEYAGSRKKNAYKEWKRTVEAYRYAFDVPAKNLAPRVWLKLRGEAKEAVEHLEISELNTDDGMDVLWDILDKAFGQIEVEKLEECMDGFWSFRRTYGMDMESYITGLRTAKRRMEKEDPGSKLSDKAYSVRLLKRSGLSIEEKRQVLAATNAVYETKQIEQALLQMFRDAARYDKARAGQFRVKSGGKASGKGRWKPRFQRGTYFAEEEDEQGEITEEEVDEERFQYEAYNAGDLEEDEQYHDEADVDDELEREESEALAAFLSAKQRLNKAKRLNQRGSNGGGRGGGGGGRGSGSQRPSQQDIKDRKSKSRCSDCRQYGHWHGDPECPKVKSGEVPVRQPRDAQYADAHYASTQDGYDGGGYAGGDAWQAGPGQVVCPKCWHKFDHPVRGGNQHANWENCPKCAARLRTRYKDGRDSPAPRGGAKGGRWPSWQEQQRADAQGKGDGKGDPPPAAPPDAWAAGAAAAAAAGAGGGGQQGQQGPQGVFMAEISAEAYDAFTARKQADDMSTKGIWDSGCRKTVAGEAWIRDYIQIVESLGHSVHYEDDDTTFRFGNQGLLRSKKRWRLPVQLYGVPCILKVSEVPGHCPLLISESSMEELDVTMSFKKRLISVGALELVDCPLEFHPSGHPVVDLVPTQVPGSAQFCFIAEEDKEKPMGAMTSLEHLYEDDWTQDAYKVTVKKGVRKRLLQLTGLAKNNEVDQCDRKSVLKKRPWKFLEVFTWTFALTRAAAMAGWDVLEPVTTTSGWEIHKPDVYKQALQYVDREAPDLIVVSWSEQDWRQENDCRTLAAKVRLRFAQHLLERQAARGKQFLVRDVAASPSWRTSYGRLVRDNLAEVIVPFSAFLGGAAGPSTPLRLVSTGKTALSLLPSGDKGRWKSYPGDAKITFGDHEDFGERILNAFEAVFLRQKQQAFDALITADEIRDMRRRALLDDVPVQFKKSQRRFLLDDVPTSIRRALQLDRPGPGRRRRGSEDKIPQWRPEERTEDGATEVHEEVPYPAKRLRRERLETVPEQDDEEYVPQWIPPEAAPRRARCPTDEEEIPYLPNNRDVETPQAAPAEEEHVPVPENMPSTATGRRRLRQKTPDPDWPGHEPEPPQFSATDNRHDPYGSSRWAAPEPEAGHGPVRRRLRHKQPAAGWPRGPSEEIPQWDAEEPRATDAAESDGEPADGAEEEEEATATPETRGSEPTPDEFERQHEELRYEDFIREPNVEDEAYDDFVDMEEQAIGQEQEILEEDPRPEIREEIKKEVRKAHQNLGHPSRETFVRMLRLGGASQEALRYAQQWKCAICARSQPPAQLMPASHHGADNFNDVVGIDLLRIRDQDQTQYWVLSMVDIASRYHNAVVVEDKRPPTIAHAFACYWLRWAGSPRRIICDQGGEFQGAFQRLMEKINAGIFVTATDSAWQNGLVERHGGILKVIYAKIVDDVGASGAAEVEMALIAATTAKNQLASRHGFSPIQHVLGQDIRLPGSVLNGEGDMAAHSWALESGPYQKRLAMREAARMAWIRLDNSSRLRRALLARTRRRPGPWMPGEQVYFWKKAGRSGSKQNRPRRRQDPDRWVGPAVVLSTEGQSIVWLSYHAQLLKVSAEHVRKATALENASVRYVLDQMAQVNGMLQVPRGQSSFVDMTAQEGTPDFGEEWFAAPRREPAAAREDGEREPDQEPGRPPSVPATPAAAPQAEPAQVPVEARDVPVPEDDDDLMEDLPDTNLLIAKNTTAGRGTRELNPKRFDVKEREAFRQADLKQLQTWKDKQAITVIPENRVKEIPRDRILPGRARVVRTNKAEPGMELMARSRIVVPGHLDQDLGSFRNDAPTAPQLALFMTFTAAATFKWKLKSFDVEAAFLNGVPLERLLYVRPPLDLAGQNPRELWKLEKAVFGLTEAPRYWWLRIRKDLLETGWYEVPFLPATFVLYDQLGLCGILILHVDDGLTAGEGRRYDKALKDLQSRAPLDKWRQGVFEFTGRRIRQKEDFTVEIDQEAYFEKVQPIKIEKGRLKTPEAPLTDEEFVALRSLVGKLSWPARETMPGLNFPVSCLQQSLGEGADGKRLAKVEHLSMANRALTKAKGILANQEKLQYQALDVKKLCALTYTDASFANMPRLGSQSGVITMLTSENVKVTGAPAAIIEWGSTRIKRVVKSTLAAESASLAIGHDRNEFARVAAAYLFGKIRADDAKKMKQWQQSLDTVSGLMAVDAKSLYDMLQKTRSLPSEKRISLDLLAVRESMEASNLQVFWTPTKWMLADSLTKEMKQHEALNIVMRTGSYSLQQDALVALERSAS